MKVPAGRGRETLAVALAVLAFVVLLGFAMYRLVQLERDNYASSGEGIIWALSQAQYEIQRLLLATTPGSFATADEIALRYDVLISRLNLLQEGPLAQRIAEAGRGNVAARAMADLLELEPLISSSGDQVERFSLRLARTMHQYLQPLGSIANELMIQNRIVDGQRRNSYNANIVQVIFSVFGIMATGAFLILRLMSSLGKSAAAEAQVRREKNFLDLLLVSSGEGIAAFDARLICTHWNEGMSKLFGVRAEKSLGRSIVELDPTVSGQNLDDVLKGSPSYLAPELRGDGTYLERVLHPIRLNDEVTGGILIVRDVTERYDAQRERQLREVYRDFVTMVSHQFRTPLAVIDSTMHRMVRRGSKMDEAELVERAKTIRVSVSSLTRLIDATLTAERVDAGIFDLALRPVDLEELIRSVCARYTELTPERRFQLDIRLGMALVCDALLIDQALANLVGNAVKYSPEAAPVEIVAVDDGLAVTIMVTDHGVGIPQPQQERVFDRFFRASTSTSIPGTGVGLYTARQIALLHGGDITLSSIEGQGSTFTLRLPHKIVPEMVRDAV